MIELVIPTLTITGSVGIVTAALALGFRHGIDWDHIAAITDITSTAADSTVEDEHWLVREPGVMLTDESHHTLAHAVEAPSVGVGAGETATTSVEAPPYWHSHDNGHSTASFAGLATLVEKQRPALVLGTMYALGHGSVVFVLGLLAILAREILPDWIDPIMERVVGVTLILLAIYLFYALFRFFRGQGEFKLRSRWMIVFSVARNAYEGIRSRVFGRPRQHVHAAQSYGVRTAMGIGMIHGVGAETGTQALVIATAVGASSQFLGVVSLCAFIVGLLISNSIITLVSSMGFGTTKQRQWVYVGAGAFAAVFSLAVGIVFLLQSGDILPSIDPFA